MMEVTGVGIFMNLVNGKNKLARLNYLDKQLS
jgi:hypothetical protein